jgi:hypothetical protein
MQSPRACKSLTAFLGCCACSDQRKLLHTILNSLAVIAAVLGVIAAFNSHTLKRPVPTANLYSPHSYLGILTLVMLGLQACRAPASPAHPWPYHARDTSPPA